MDHTGAWSPAVCEKRAGSVLVAVECTATYAVPAVHERTAGSVLVAVVNGGQAACWWLLCALPHTLSPAVRERRAGSVLAALPHTLSKL